MSPAWHFLGGLQSLPTSVVRDLHPSRAVSAWCNRRARKAPVFSGKKCSPCPELRTLSSSGNLASLVLTLIFMSFQKKTPPPHSVLIFLSQSFLSEFNCKETFLLYGEEGCCLTGKQGSSPLSTTPPPYVTSLLPLQLLSCV